jgi:hypothetical protein
VAAIALIGIRAAASRFTASSEGTPQAVSEAPPAPGALPLTIGDHCSRRTSRNWPPFVRPLFHKAPTQDIGGSRVGRGFDHEVWPLDGSNTSGLAHGGTLYIYDPHQLRCDAANAMPEVVGLGGETSALCMAETG